MINGRPNTQADIDGYRKNNPLKWAMKFSNNELLKKKAEEMLNAYGQGIHDGAGVPEGYNELVSAIKSGIPMVDTVQEVATAPVVEAPKVSEEAAPTTATTSSDEEADGEGSIEDDLDVEDTDTETKPEALTTPAPKTVANGGTKTKTTPAPKKGGK